MDVYLGSMGCLQLKITTCTSSRYECLHDYYFHLFSMYLNLLLKKAHNAFWMQKYHPTRIITLTYQPFVLATTVIFTYHEANVNTRVRNLAGYMLFFLTSFGVIIVSPANYCLQTHKWSSLICSCSGSWMFCLQEVVELPHSLVSVSLLLLLGLLMVMFKVGWRVISLWCAQSSSRYHLRRFFFLERFKKHILKCRLTYMSIHFIIFSPSLLDWLHQER